MPTKFKLNWAVALIALCQSAAAQTPLTADEFKALSDGKTLYFSQNGRYYGAEQYLRNNRVRWQSANGECIDGQWFGQNGALCFQYDGADGPICWVMWNEAERLLAVPTDRPDNVPIELTRKDEFPLPCAGPDLGV